MNLRLTAAAALLAVSLAAADETPATKPARVVRVSLKECVHLALSRGLEAEIARYQPWIDDQSILSALGAFDHVAYANLSGGESVSRSTSALGGAETLDVDSFSERAGVRRQIPIGLSYDLFFQTDRSLTNSTFATINPRWTETLGLSVTMPILRGRGEEAVYAGVVIARRSKQISTLQFETALAAQVQAVHAAYWDLVFALEQRRVREQSLHVAARVLEDARKKLESGIFTRVDVTEAESGVAGQQEGILTAEKAVQDAMDRLKRLVDPAMLREEASLLPLDAPAPPMADLDERAAVAAAIQEALAKRADYLAFAHQMSIQESTIARARNDRLPRLDLTASGTLSGTDNAFSGANKELRELDTRDFTVGIVFEIPLEGRSAAAAVQKAELEKRRLWLQRRNLEDQILVEVREAVRAVKTAEKRIEATRKAEALALEQLDGELSRKERGLRTTFHVLEAERRRTEARTNAVKAMIDYQLALQQVYKVSGTLLEKNDVLLADQLVPRLAANR